MANQLTAALVGCGSVSQRGILPHLSLPDAREKVRLAAVVDVVEERARQTALRFDVPAFYTSIEAMLDDAAAGLDMVLIATPIPYHFPTAMAAIEAGKHVYVQKPLAVTLEQANRLLEARDRAGVKLAAAPGYDLFPLTRRMRQIVTAGVLGHTAVAYTFTMGFGHEREPIRAGEGALEAIDPTWYYQAGAGPVADVTIYALQLATSVLGPARRVTALSNRLAPRREWKGKSIPVEIDDNNLILIEFASGALCTAVGSDCRGSSRIPWGAMDIYGTAGVLELTGIHFPSAYPIAFQVRGGLWEEGPPARYNEVRTFSAELTEQQYLQEEHLEIEEPHVYVDIMDLADAVLGDRPPGASGEQARHVVEIIEKSRVAAETGQVQGLDTGF